MTERTGTLLPEASEADWAALFAHAHLRQTAHPADRRFHPHHFTPKMKNQRSAVRIADPTNVITAQRLFVESS